MKRLLFLLTILPVVAFSQSATDILPMKDGKVHYEDIVMVDSTASKDALFTAIRSSISTLFSNSKRGVQQDDKESGKIIFKASAPVKQVVLLTTDYYDINYTLDVTVKDGKYRIQAYDIDAVPGRSGQPYRSIDRIIEQAEKGALKKSSKELLKLIDGTVTSSITSIKGDVKKRLNSDF